MILLSWLLYLSTPVGLIATSRPQEGRNLFAMRACCKRHQHYVYMGRDISGSLVGVDVGVCRTSCSGPQRTNNVYSSELPVFPKQLSMLDFLRNKKERFLRAPTGPEHPGVPRESCPLDHHCEPSSVRLENLLLLGGIQQVEIVEGCQCNPSPSECLRLPSLKTFFADTPVERTVDVGRCSRPPRPKDGRLCMPVHFDPVLLKSPNGPHVVQTVGSCALQDPCYRIPHLVYYYEVALGAKGERVQQLKEIDVGRCLGQCLSGNRCLLRDPLTQEKCLIWAEGVSSHCFPHQYETHTFQSRSGQLRTVSAIRTCKCGSFQDSEVGTPLMLEVEEN